MYSFPPFLWYPPNSDTPQTFQAQLCAVPRGFFSSCTAHKLFLFMFPPASLKAELRVSSPPPLLPNAACGQGRSSGRVAEIGSHTYVAFMLPQPHDWNPAPCVPVPLFFFLVLFSTFVTSEQRVCPPSWAGGGDSAELVLSSLHSLCLLKEQEFNN